MSIFDKLKQSPAAPSAPISNGGSGPRTFAQPFTVTVETNPYSDANPGYKKLFIKSSGADNAREVVLRMKGDGQWLLWDQALLVGIREPKSADPWA